MKVVFAPHVAPSGPGVEDAVEFVIKGEGLRSVKETGLEEEEEQVGIPR